MKKIDKTIEIFKAIGDNTRFKILRLLSQKGQLCVNALTHHLKIAQPTVSQHLKVLKNAEIVKAKKLGNHVHYSLRNNTLEKVNKQILDFLQPPAGDCSDDDSGISCKDK